ncbi:hypothetical protein VCCP103710_2503 [Vibrio cholerae CP1037(10)]|nr:hypothetical protein VCCP103710_2503 [Vibrio cholerae CP1037(10)]EMP84983.1 hypothetical protein VC116063_002354 [Vibrio cholerae O1 str. 116063]
MFFSANAKVCRRMCLTLSKFTGGTSFRDISLMPISEIYEWLREAEEMMVESKDGE